MSTEAGVQRGLLARSGTGDAEEEETSNVLVRVGLHAKQVGASFQVGVGESVVLYVAAMPCLSAAASQQVQAGQRVDFEGPLFLQHGDTKIFRVIVQGSWGISCAAMDGMWRSSADLKSQISGKTDGQLFGEAQDTRPYAERTLDLGKVGHVNEWQPVSFQLPVSNPSSVPLCVTASIVTASWIPEAAACGVEGNEEGDQVEGAVVEAVGREGVCPHLLGFVPESSEAQRAEEAGQELAAVGRLVVAAGSAGKLEARLVPSLVVDSGVCRYLVRVQNEHDHRNHIQYTVTARVIAGTLLRFSGRQISLATDAAARALMQGGAADGAGAAGGGLFQLVMPELAFPVANDDQCSESFTVTNTSDEPLELCAKAHAEPWLADVLTVDVLSSSSSTHVNSFSLDPQQTMHIMLAIKGKETVVAVPEALRGGRRVAVARVSFVSSSLPEEQVLVLGTFSQRATLQLSVERINLTFPADLTLPPPLLVSPGTVAAEGAALGGQLGVFPPDGSSISERGLGALREMSPLAQSASFTLRSKCAAPVPFAITLRLPSGLSADSVTVHPQAGVLAAGGGCEEISVTVDVPTDAHGRFVTCQGPSAVGLRVQDTRLEHLCAESQAGPQLPAVDGGAAAGEDVQRWGSRELVVNLLREAVDESVAAKGSQEQTRAERAALALRGCRVICRDLELRGGEDGDEDADVDVDEENDPLGQALAASRQQLFEISAGKVNQHAQHGAVEWTLELEYVGSGGAQSYSLSTTRGEDCLPVSRVSLLNHGSSCQWTHT